ncbi:hypothetical protein BURK2_04335 [Burkholderiales bacterium]|nr:MAG: hypothetical protein F9K47_12570 [Burkholderiales bacterium]CAG1011692.1 hypothetical protein BURK2_04335 [Burkholderiales bacterium]
MSTEPQYWFPAKRVGWGWGPPSAWQGWLVLALFVVLVLVGAVKLLPTYGQFTFFGYTLLLCAALMAVCWLKGEPPGRKRQ